MALHIANTIATLIFCHLIGDYVLQSAYIAETKSENFYHLLVHCILYLLPFYICFYYNKYVFYILGLLLCTHLCIDLLKCKLFINYVTDQILHYIVLLLVGSILLT